MTTCTLIFLANCNQNIVFTLEKVSPLTGSVRDSKANMAAVSLFWDTGCDVLSKRSTLNQTSYLIISSFTTLKAVFTLYRIAFLVYMKSYPI